MAELTRNELVKKIASSRKYQPLYEKTIERVLEKYPEKEAEKRARNLLHQIWSAYFDPRPNFKKLLKKIQSGGRSSGVSSISSMVLPILKLQSSTAERIPILNDFYRKIFAITGQPKTIIDWACGLNPLSWPWMNLSENCHYLGLDIDKEQNDFLNNVFKIAGLKQFQAKLGDILIDKSPEADVIFLLKILPLLEHQQKGVSLNILKKMPARFLVISFPTKSISGRQKGMIDFYSKQFQDLIRNQPWQSKKLLFENELVFIIKK